MPIATSSSPVVMVARLLDWPNGERPPDPLTAIMRSYHRSIVSANEVFVAPRAGHSVEFDINDQVTAEAVATCQMS